MGYQDELFILLKKMFENYDPKNYDINKNDIYTCFFLIKKYIKNIKKFEQILSYLNDNTNKNIGNEIKKTNEIKEIKNDKKKAQFYSLLTIATSLLKNIKDLINVYGLNMVEFIKKNYIALSNISKFVHTFDIKQLNEKTINYIIDIMKNLVIISFKTPKKIVENKEENNKDVYENVLNILDEFEKEISHIDANKNKFKDPQVDTNFALLTEKNEQKNEKFKENIIPTELKNIDENKTKNVIDKNEKEQINDSLDVKNLINSLSLIIQEIKND